MQTAIKESISQLASEPSTYRGVIWLLTGLGLSISPELSEHIVATGATLAGLIGFLFRDK